MSCKCLPSQSVLPDIYDEYERSLMVFSQYSNPKLGYIVYVILLTCLVFLFFQLANNNGNEKGKFLGSQKLSYYSDQNENSHLTDTGAATRTTFKLSEIKGDEVRQIEVKRNLMFIKTHKCGTSTLVDVFYLKGVRDRLNFVMHPYTHQLNIGAKR